jgi:hypothetical protein
MSGLCGQVKEDCGHLSEPYRQVSGLCGQMSEPYGQLKKVCGYVKNPRGEVKLSLESILFSVISGNCKERGYRMMNDE